MKDIQVYPSNVVGVLGPGACGLQVHVAMPRKRAAAEWRTCAGAGLVSFAFKDRSDRHGGVSELVPL